MRGDNLGEFEQLVLLALLRLGEEAYGVTVRREIAARTGRDTAIGAIYATLDRLEQKGFAESSLGESTSARGGRAKRYFRVTASGHAALSESLNATARMQEGLELA